MQGESVRLAELVAAVSLGTDLGMGERLETALRSTLVALRLGERAGLDENLLAQTYYVSLLMFIGCTADAHIPGDLFGDTHQMHVAARPHIFASSEMKMMRAAMPLMARGAKGPAAAARIARTMARVPRAMNEVTAGHCEVAVRMSERLGVDPVTRDAFAAISARWDGRNTGVKVKGDAIPLPVRVVTVARDAEWHRQLAGADAAAETVGSRAGKAHDPNLARLFAEHAASILSGLDAGSVWDEVVGSEPGSRPTLTGDAFDAALEAVADFVDLQSPFLREHSRGVAALAAAAASRCGLAPDQSTLVRRAALIHDIGRIAVSVSTWGNASALSRDEVEAVRLHPYHCERIFSASPALAPLARIASMHHERMDGSGYHRGTDGSAMPLAARLIAAADVYHAMTEPRPHRTPLEPETAQKELRADAAAGRLDAAAVDAVLAAAGHSTTRPTQRPAGLTAREVDVLRLVARGLPTKAIARGLEISPKTADNHIQRIYAKCGVTTRAGATLFAMQNGLCSETA